MDPLAISSEDQDVPFKYHWCGKGSGYVHGWRVSSNAQLDSHLTSPTPDSQFLRLQWDSHLDIEVLETDWAGDRIILIGDYADAFPPGILTDEEAKELDPAESMSSCRCQKSDQITDKFESTRFERRLSSFERLPYDALDIIFSQLPRPSLAACALLSTRVYSAPHWESVRVLHEILKQLPRLVSLHVLPSWITYGDLPYWEYPFKLRKIKWGLIKDEGSQKFISSQSGTLEEIGYLKIRSSDKEEDGPVVNDYNSVGMPTYWEECESESDS
ncbi:11883_t:CDS:2 [Acaulospora colombiana]|uniref:11883_t:CDS:1 n=1 Tax=Acaulospora colombiana TaxID=27376 RepID=A0ACA9NUL9_9GLOM|nr:11883_t:CDS:2 [Acaulospora colombiana]